MPPNMKRPVITLFILVCLLTTTRFSAIRAEVIESDICVFGGTSAGIVSAIQAQHMGKKAVIVNPSKYLGGLTTGGLGATDIGNKAAVGGISRDFYHRIAKHYSQETAWTLETRQDYFTKRGSGQAKQSNLDTEDATMWTFEPHVAEQIYLEMLKEAQVTVYAEQRLVSVKKDGLRIVEITTDKGTVFRAKMFIDATYEGDLMAKAKVSYVVGREGNAQFNETLDGIRDKTPHHQFTVAVDPYVKPGDASSGLLPLIQSAPLGKAGDEDKSVQAYNYRLCFTTNAANRLPVAPPPDYDAKRFELLGRYLEALVAAGKKPALGQFWNPIWMPNGKTDINNNGGFSTDYIGYNHDYPEADYATRDKITKDHENYIRGFITFMATDPRVPEYMRNDMKRWGPAKDEFRDTDGWPRELYVREARRMVADYVMSEKNCRGEEVITDSISLAAYNMDSHNCRRIVRNGKVENEGDVQVPPMKPYPVSYRAIVPKASECDNLFVPVCLSSTHIAYGSIRMEPVFMILGQSSATAAAMAIDQGVPVQKVNYEKLRARLLEDRQILEWKGAAKTAREFVAPKDLKGIVLDDTEGVKKGEWQESSTIAPRLGHGYAHDGNANKGELSIAFTPEIPQAGEYEIVFISVPNGNRDASVPVTVTIEGGASKTVSVNEKDDAKHGFYSLGNYTLPQGKKTTVTVSNKDTKGFVVVDGVQFIPVK